ncbi:carbonate dehydratase, partial [Vibrio parahaemolyticus]|nr:carbonate dehydratase [Vibrio parahaemolyticus]
ETVEAAYQNALSTILNTDTKLLCR